MGSNKWQRSKDPSHKIPPALNSSATYWESFSINLTMSLSGTTLSTSSSMSSSTSTPTSLNNSSMHGTKSSSTQGWLSNFTTSTSSSSQSSTSGGDRLCRDLNVWIPQSL